MERDQLIDELPDGLAATLRLYEAGQPSSVIAVALAVPVESVPTLLQLALAKLQKLIDESELAADSGIDQHGPRTESRAPESASPKSVGSNQ
ncbi:hypothetical protein FOE78_00455 [Microlunatus elymi]|uniref:Sigma-70, region 4 n=1 Tax=Microlunatus elymi TaxID=2596828 RepID=A0A516PTR5_9ACTN|nr:hypothetical protein [Microlunatus elymi]QDP94586.1 hypothetical protein FOE78_00455 [Microlunatus elymi]